MSIGRGPRVHSYDGGEFMLAYGPRNGPQLLVIQPLFEEMNRCRALVSALCHELAERGIGCWLPDLPGTGESLRPLERIGWEDWMSAARAAGETVRESTGLMPATIAIRGGVLLDGALSGPHWRLSPTSGRSLLSDLRRSALASGGDPSAPAGYRLAEALIAPLEAAEAMADGSTRTLRLAADDRPADLHVEGPPIWRRPEPSSAPELAALLANDIHAWTMV